MTRRLLAILGVFSFSFEDFLDLRSTRVSPNIICGMFTQQTVGSLVKSHGLELSQLSDCALSESVIVVRKAR